MDRKEFLASITLSAASFAVMSCIGCSKSSDNTSPSGTAGPTSIDFTLDLSATANSALLAKGGSMFSNGVIIAHTTAGNYIAVQRSCTHENYDLTYQSNVPRFYCNNHGSAFTEKGVVLNSPANRNLTVYNTMLTGTSLRVYS